MKRRLVVPALTAEAVAADRRGARRAAAIAAGNLAGYRMAGRTEQARKGPGSYTRTPKHRHQEDR